MKRVTIKDNYDMLRTASSDVDFENDNYMDYVKKLENYCLNNRVYALAPVQIGIPKRMIYLRNTTEDMTKNICSNYNEEIVLINPVIISRTGHAKFLERCESCLDYVGVIDRPYSVTVKYFDISRNIHVEEFTGFRAIVFSHEFDHLNGILHMDRTDKIMQMNWDETKKYRDNHPMEVISKLGDYKDSFFDNMKQIIKKK